MGQIKLTVDDELARELEMLSSDRQAAINDELRSQLAALVRRQPVRNERAERARRIAAMTPKGIVQTDSTLLIREDRDR